MRLPELSAESWNQSKGALKRARKENPRRHQRSNAQQACQHTRIEAAGCLLVPGAALLLVALQLALLLDVAVTGRH